MTKLIIDSSVWVDYLSATKRGEKIKDYFENNELFTTSVCVAEIVAKVLREGFSAEIALSAIRSRSSIVSIDYSIGSDAGKIYFELRKTRSKIALSDAISIAVARKNSAKVLTFDRDFEKLPEAIVLS